MNTRFRIFSALLITSFLLLAACNAPFFSPAQDNVTETTPDTSQDPTRLTPTITPEPAPESVLLDPCTLLEEQEVTAVLGGAVQVQPAAGTGGCNYMMQGESPTDMIQMIVSAAQGNEAKSLTLLSMGMLAGFSGDPALQTEFEALNNQIDTLSLGELVEALAVLLQGPELVVELNEEAGKLTLWIVYESEVYKQATLILVQEEEYISINQIGGEALKSKDELGGLAATALERLPPAFYVLDETGDGSILIDMGDDSSTPEAVPTATAEPDVSGLIWVAAGNAGQVYAIDPLSHETMTTIDIGRFPNDIAVLAGNVWVISETEGTLWRVDPELFEVVEAIQHTGNTKYIAAADGAVWITGGLGIRMLDVESGSRYDVAYNDCYDVVIGAGSVWVSQNRDQQVLRLDPETRRIVSTIKLDGTPTDLVYGHDRLWVVLYDKRELIAIDPESEEIVNRLTSKYPIHGLAVDPERIWYTLPNGVQFFKPATLGAGRLSLPHPPNKLMYFAGSLWATSPNDGFLTRIDPDEMMILDEINLGTDPGAIAAGE